jgi:hypothetical protein
MKDPELDSLCEEILALQHALNYRRDQLRQKMKSKNLVGYTHHQYYFLIDEKLSHYEKRGTRK